MSASQVMKKIKAVHCGSVVIINIGGNEQIWEIVDIGKSEPKNGKISLDAPLTKIILGKPEGELVKGKINNREVAIMIKKII